MKCVLLALVITLAGPTMNAETQSGTVSGGIVLEASRLTNFPGKVELREAAVVTTEDLVLRADAADFFPGINQRIEARGAVSVSINPKRVALLQQRLTQLRVTQDVLGPNHPDIRLLLGEVAELETLQRKVEACKPGPLGLRIELPPAMRIDPRESFISQLNGSPEPLREFRCLSL
jgi:hypothetical protein